MNKLLQAHIEHCQRDECVATIRLQGIGAKLLLGKGRHLEIAALAAASPPGIIDRDLVQRRRDYAEHLGVRLDGPVANAEYAGHADWAAKGPDVNKGPIHLGRATVTKIVSPQGSEYDHYVLNW